MNIVLTETDAFEITYVVLGALAEQNLITRETTKGIMCEHHEGDRSKTNMLNQRIAYLLNERLSDINMDEGGNSPDPDNGAHFVAHDVAAERCLNHQGAG